MRKSQSKSKPRGMRVMGKGVMNVLFLMTLLAALHTVSMIRKVSTDKLGDTSHRDDSVASLNSIEEFKAKLKARISNHIVEIEKGDREHRTRLSNLEEVEATAHNAQSTYTFYHEATPMMDPQSCSNLSAHEVRSFHLPNHGWGNDISRLLAAFVEGWEEGKATVIAPTEYHYSVGYTTEKLRMNINPPHLEDTLVPNAGPACKNRDLSCYFEPIPCTVVPVDHFRDMDYDQKLAFAREKMLKPHSWIREEVERRVAALAIITPFAVIHVRRSDTVLNFGWNANSDPTKRVSILRYVPLSEYFAAARRVLMDEHKHVKTAFLISDSATTFEELAMLGANETLGLRLVYLERPRFRGSEGGWENHFPSGNCTEEVLHILAIESVVKKASVWVGTRSSFAQFLQMGIRPKMTEVLISNKPGTSS